MGLTISCMVVLMAIMAILAIMASLNMENSSTGSLANMACLANTSSWGTRDGSDSLPKVTRLLLSILAFYFSVDDEFLVHFGCLFTDISMLSTLSIWFRVYIVFTLS
uniref:Putative ovule protein n=1 Tax=Solanum chacoense TaxID=4108 RepID=A0A0V0HLV9_SOLCH